MQASRKLRPSVDPNVPHPGRRFVSGQWYSPEQLERRRVRSNERRRERLRNDPEFAERQRERDRARAPERRERVLRRKRELYGERKEAGLCVSCGQMALSEVLCWDCLSRREYQNALAV